jgi:hypothetical protein
MIVNWAQDEARTVSLEQKERCWSRERSRTDQAGEVGAAGTGRVRKSKGIRQAVRATAGHVKRSGSSAGPRCAEN